MSLILVLLFAFVGCSDDDECASCPGMTQKAVAIGDLELDDGLYFWANIIGVDGKVPDVDSVRVAGELAETYTGFNEGGPGVYVQYEEYEGGPMKPASTYANGDLVLVEIFTPSGVSTCSEKVLDYDLSRPVPIDWSYNYPYDTVDIGTELTVSWNTVEYADWYAVEAEYDYDSSGIQNETRSYFNTTGTTVTIPAASVGFNGRYYMRIRPITGPLPDDAQGNITGGVVRGVIGSSSYRSFNIYVGTGVYYSVPGESDEDQTEQSYYRQLINDQTF